ncbi:CDP-Glycerol:Poly(glycerophosphate) glycerophosphotransferase [Selenomonas ruminantium]|uniref:CDP-Glycerol:Poly(Glycerophosphate) glycerophosphotransferase n=1 Tax=Selenomonas ruminantium TaxID=971 RepID=A0A1M6W1W0_SELRU|nr:CDP-glycerol glycerophosphotransferase family protein [Selenomonas ruminantium]SHK87700.1 CDP-Glycerol:Poly(glycerophosphate) glycerophosphotransferase [Selenomonas ruminantium]
MMNRSTQKELIKLLLQLNEMWPQMELQDKEQQIMVLDILNTVTSKCQQDFSKEKTAEYTDTLQALGQVIQSTDWQHTSKEELAQCIGLCQEIILQVTNNLRQEKEIKKDIVFLPYKASMWDSFESVWKAAYEDKEHCNTYVIPIPYCDRNPDGSVAQWHCEKEMFPQYVKTLDWQTIDLKEWHPDIIFFHNPYDDLNRVTSVESRFYSRNLKECTDKLVYIPYFVFDENCSEDDVGNFALSLGVINSDRVIVQSESIRDKYISVLTKRTNQTNRSYWEKRILGLGSPKIDKVINSEREDFDIPVGWQNMIAGKKVILYITSLTPMLANTDKVCNKLRSVFDIFRKQQDVLLWWRPHPLMKASIHSMCPQIEKEYLQIEKEYVKEQWGIYDETGDLHRAIAFSDAYYGDGSSVHKLYSRTHKPILIQQYEEIKEIKHSFRKKYKEEDIPKDFKSGLVMEGEPFDLFDLIETVKNVTFENIVTDLVERPKWDKIWLEKDS